MHRGFFEMSWWGSLEVKHVLFKEHLKHHGSTAVSEFAGKRSGV